MTEPEDYEIQDFDKYYGQDHAFEFIDLIKEHDLASKRVLYVGCGRGDSMGLYGCHSRGIDFNANLEPYWDSEGLYCYVGDARNMPEFRPWARNGPLFDVTFSVDFFEHVKVGDIPAVYSELTRVAAAGLHVIDAKPQSGYRGVGKKNLHASGALSLSQWQGLLKEATVTSYKGNHLIAKWGF